MPLVDRRAGEWAPAGAGRGPSAVLPGAVVLRRGTDPTTGTPDPTTGTADPTTGTADPTTGTADPTTGTAGAAARGPRVPGDRPPAEASRSCRPLTAPPAGA